MALSIPDTDENGAVIYCLHIDGKFMDYETVGACIKRHKIALSGYYFTPRRSIYTNISTAKSMRTRMPVELREYIQIVRYTANEVVQL